MFIYTQKFTWLKFIADLVILPITVTLNFLPWIENFRFEAEFFLQYMTSTQQHILFTVHDQHSLCMTSKLSNAHIWLLHYFIFPNDHGTEYQLNGAMHWTWWVVNGNQFQGHFYHTHHDEHFSIWLSHDGSTMFVYVCICRYWIYIAVCKPVTIHVYTCDCSADTWI